MSWKQRRGGSEEGRGLMTVHRYVTKEVMHGGIMKHIATKNRPKFTIVVLMVKLHGHILICY